MVFYHWRMPFIENQENNLVGTSKKENNWKRYKHLCCCSKQQKRRKKL